MVIYSLIGMRQCKRLAMGIVVVPLVIHYIYEGVGAVDSTLSAMLVVVSERVSAIRRCLAIKR